MLKLKITLVLIFLTSYVTLKKAPNVSNNTIVNGKSKSIKKLGLPNTNLYIFNNPGKMIDFKNFVSDKFNLNNYLLAERVNVELNDINFEMIIHTPEFNSMDADLISTAISHKKNKGGSIVDDIETTSTNLNYVAISFEYENEDCLSINSLFYNISKKYLDELTYEYLMLYE